MVDRSRAVWGALFDWDGVLVDSRALHQAAWDEVAREFGYRHDAADFERHFGLQNRRAIIEILGWTQDATLALRIADRKENIYRERLARSSSSWMEGALAFVDLLMERGIPRAIVSSSPRQNIDAVLADGDLRARFASIVTAEDTRVGKPDPEGFLLGAARLGLPAQRCVVFEDAPAGIRAGRAGGMRVVALTTTHGAAALGEAHVVTNALTRALADQIEAWFEAAPA